MEEDTTITQQETQQEAQETVEKKVRKVKDTSGNFVVWAVKNPHNDAVIQKRFRSSEEVVGVVFAKFKEGTPEREKFEHFPDGSVAWTWTTQKKRFDATMKDLDSGNRTYIEPGSVIGELNVLRVGEVEEKVRQPRAAKEQRVAKERAPRVAKDGTGKKPQPSTFKGLLPEEDTMELKFESYEEDGSTSVEVKAFSSKKAALVHARTLGLSSEEAEAAVTKVDGEWTVTQN